MKTIMNAVSSRAPLPPFDQEAAIKRVKLAEDAWNTRDPDKVAPAYTIDSVWRNRTEFLSGREAITRFLARKWVREQHYRLIRELWAFHGSRIAVRFAYEWHDDSGNWFRSFGNENWGFAGNGLIARRLASVNDLPIQDTDRKFFWALGPAPTITPGFPNSVCKRSANPPQ